VELTRRALLASAVAGALAGCSRTSSPALALGRRSPSPSPSGQPSGTPTPSAKATGSPAPAAIAARATVSVLCWHQLRDWKAGDSSYAKQLLICPPAAFRVQLDALQQAGYTTIGPDRYLDHLSTGAALPPRPVLLSFDDAQGTQAVEALPQLVKRKMTGTFFAMTVVLGKTGWLSNDDLRRMDAAGMTIAAHTYDHHRVDRYTAPDYPLQLQKPRELLEKILGKPVQHFAYPYGAWNAAALPHVAAAGYRTAFQLSDKPLDPAVPLLTLRRILMNSTWTGPQLLNQL